MLRLAAKNGGEPNDLTRRFEETPDPGDRLLLMFDATGIAQAITYSNQVVAYLAQLSKEFNACAKLRENAVRALPGILVEWSAMVTDPSAAQATDATQYLEVPLEERLRLVTVLLLQMAKHAVGNREHALELL